MQDGGTCITRGQQNTGMHFSLYCNLYHVPSVDRRTSQSDLITHRTG